MVYIGTTIIDVETGIVAISLKKIYYYHNDTINAFAMVFEFALALARGFCVHYFFISA